MLHTCVRAHCSNPHQHRHDLISFKLYNLVVYARQIRTAVCQTQIATNKNALILVTSKVSHSKREEMIKSPSNLLIISNDLDLIQMLYAGVCSWICKLPFSFSLDFVSVSSMVVSSVLNWLKTVLNWVFVWYQKTFCHRDFAYKKWRKRYRGVWKMIAAVVVQVKVKKMIVDNGNRRQNFCFLVWDMPLERGMSGGIRIKIKSKSEW